MQALHPAVPLRLFGGHAGIVAPSLIHVIDTPVCSPGPDELGDGVEQRANFGGGSRVCGDIDPHDDEGLDVVVPIHLGDDYSLKIQVHLCPRVNRGSKKDTFSRAGSRDRGAELLLSSGGKGPPGGFGQRLANHLLASNLRVA